ncbi:MAG TPA: site-specific integrase [Candidatus Limnocylindria bacterium]|nr:site-specific integrase [Candidatus Limnocylindria bacterium]
MARTFAGGLAQWLSLHSQGRKPRAVQFNIEIAVIVRREWPGYLNGPVRGITTEQVMEFAQRVSHYCPSRWNALVSALQFITPEARTLRRRPLRAKERASLSQLEFAKLMAELDKRPRSHAGLVIRLLAQTGLRISEARQLHWSDVDDECIRVPGRITKNSQPRVIPFIPGTAQTLERLRAVSGKRVLPQSECKRSLHKACKLAEVPRLSHHDFRHLFATRCIQSGVDLPTVARWLGHQDGGALLAKTYFHLVDEHSKRMAAKVVV